MKRVFRSTTACIPILLFLQSCSKDTTPTPPPEDLSVSLLSPSNNSTGIDFSSAFDWTVEGTLDGVEITYDFYLGLDPDNLELVEEVVNDTDLTYSKLLTNQNTYYWKVVATDSTNRTAESDIFSFSTIRNSGTFTDPRDNEEYEWIGIGSQVWMTENLRFKTSDEAVGYNYEESNVPIYGRFYFRSDALVSCPDGWHLPSTEEFNQLIEFVATEEAFGTFTNYEALLKSIDGWNENGNGNNYSGYNHLPTGVWNSQNEFANTGVEGYQWSSTFSSPDRGSIFGTIAIANTFYVLDDILIGGVNSQRHCIRCIKD